MAEPIYRRVVIKLSGEYLAGSHGFGIDQPTRRPRRRRPDRGAQARRRGRGRDRRRQHRPRRRGVLARRVAADRRHHGHARHHDELPALEAAIERKGTPARTLSAFVMPEISELFTRTATRTIPRRGRIVLLGGGTGNPFFTTDTTAVLRAAEIGAQAVLKATNVDGVYSADPKKDPKAKRFDRLTHSQAIEGGYKVMDATAFALARETSLPIIVFSIAEPGSIGAILRGSGHGTVVAG